MFMQLEVSLVLLLVLLADSRQFSEYFFRGVLALFTG